jgi:hypothetical protein
MPSSFEQSEQRALARPDIGKVYDELEDEFAHNPPPEAFEDAVSATLEEWASREDDEAFRDL